tara:strand:- start:375 stop:623 length:249 start_codon:yes stop_codon:yes gene_type:complete
MITCPLCQENYIFVSSLCEECSRIRKLSSLYGRNTILTILESVLLRKQVGIIKKTELEGKKFLTYPPKKEIEPPKKEIEVEV